MCISWLLLIIINFYVLIYVLLMISNSLRMIKIYRNVSGLGQIAYTK